MNKNEKNIILNTYKDKYYSNTIGIDNKNTTTTLKILLDKLNLKEERYNIENEIISYNNNYGKITTDTFKMVIDDFKKYNVYVNYDIDDIENYYYDLTYKMTDEEVKCNNARIILLKDELIKNKRSMI